MSGIPAECCGEGLFVQWDKTICKVFSGKVPICYQISKSLLPASLLLILYVIKVVMCCHLEKDLAPGWVGNAPCNVIRSSNEN